MFLEDKFENSDIIKGLQAVTKPSECYFKNYDKALDMLHNHLNNSNKPIVVHCDVDVDGIGSAYILDRFIQGLNKIHRVGYIINKEKEHGIKDNQVDYLNKLDIGLLVILDSSTNELDLIKKLNCDVLVVDHHEILHTELQGKTATGEYIIINNMATNEEHNYIADKDMSCGLVLYELLRLYENTYSISLLEDSKLYQWVGVTLFTDAIKLANDRNQYYIDKTINQYNMEHTLKILLESLSRYDKFLSKTFISFTLAPRINKSIRAGATKEILSTILRTPEKITDFIEYDTKQKEILEYILSNLESNKLDIISSEGYNILDISNTEIPKSYNGVIASKLLDITHKSTAVGREETANIIVGSFRGLNDNIDYRMEFEKNGVYAQGHSLAFGFKAHKNKLIQILDNINHIEYQKRYLTAGDMPDHLKGIHHIDSMDKFKKEQSLLELAIANSRLSTREAVEIYLLNNKDIKVEWREKYGICNVLGLECKVFEEPVTEWLKLYIEYRDTIDIYLRNV